MKIEIDRKEFISDLEMLQFAIISSLKDNYNGLYIKAEADGTIHLVGNNKENQMEITRNHIKVIEPGECNVYAPQLLNTVKAANKPTLTLTSDTKAFEMFAMPCHARFPLRPVNSFPKIETFTAHNSITLKTEPFKEALKNVAFAVAEEKLSVYNNIWLNLQVGETNGIMKIGATNVKHMALKEYSIDTNGKTTGLTVLIPLKVSMELIKLLGNNEEETI